MESPHQERTFHLKDQRAFAAASGDWNPIHMDEVESRRTSAGGLVVHGVHAVLWALTEAARADEFQFLHELSVVFRRFIYVGERVILTVGRSEKSVRCEIRARGEIACVVTANLEKSPAGVAVPAMRVDGPVHDLGRQFANDIDFGSIRSAFGVIPGMGDIPYIRDAFSELTNAIGADAVSGLMRTSTLVGMVCPGLHSIYSSLKLVRLSQSPQDLIFECESFDETFRLATLRLFGGGWSGTLEAFSCHPPVRQPAFAEVRALAPPNFLGGQRVLVIGGSRGVGEATAKIAAAAGASVTITYEKGESDARKIADEISAGGGRCAYRHFDARGAIAAQLEDLERPTHVYYFATPSISSRPSHYAKQDFADFAAIYIDGFEALVRWLSMSAAEPVGFFYPSSVAVDAPPKNMLAYAMAKAAGELLAAEIGKSQRGAKVKVVRLPRILTDQTATIAPVAAPTAVEVMLPIILDWQSPSGERRIG